MPGRICRRDPAVAGRDRRIRSGIQRIFIKDRDGFWHQISVGGKMDTYSLMKHPFTMLATFIVAVGIAAAALQGFSAAHAAADTTATIVASSTSLQAQIDANNQQIANLNQQIAVDQAALQQVGADKQTLQAAIKALDLQRNKVQAQVAVTEHQITTTKLQIQQLGGEITDTKATIATDQAALGASLQAFQKTEDQPLFMRILSFNTLSQIWSDSNANLQIQEAIQNNMQALQTQKNNLAASQATSQQKQAVLTSQQQSLAAQQQSLAATVQSKNQLLVQTNAKESAYEKLLAAAEAELKSFSAFAQNAGGSKLLGNQTVCDAWGCYYNQRDTAWGNDSLDGTSFKLASDGCLVTAMAMVITHYGYRDVTPVTINSNPDNFAAYYPADLLTTIVVDGISATRKTTTINAMLATGNPVIVGLYAYGGTHFVVLVSGSNGNYLMRDPYIMNGNNISFSDHYSVRNIFSVSKVAISS